MKKPNTFIWFAGMMSVVLLAVFSCNQEDLLEEKPAVESQLQEDNFPPEISFRSGEPCLAPFFELFAAHFEQFRGEDPSVYFPDELIGDFRTKLDEEDAKMKTMGFGPYLNGLQANGKISPETKGLMLHIHQSVEVEGNVIIQDLITDLETSYDPASLTTYDPFYCYVYNIALEIYNNYYGSGTATDSTSLQFRGDCDFKDFVKHVIETAGQGAAIGGILGEIISDLDSLFVIQALGITIEVGGEIIGGAIGAIIGIFTHDDDSCSDCHPVTFIAVTSDDDCDLTRTLEAIGAGPDALAFTWAISQGGATVFITTTLPFLTVTQAVNEEPIGVSVASLCLPDGENNAVLTPFTPTRFIDLSTDSSSPLGQPGNIEITAIGSGLGSVGQNSITSHVGLFTTFFWHNSNEASGHIQQTTSIVPASLGNIVQTINDNAVKVQWASTGSGYFRVTAVNTCSGLTTFKSFPVTVN